MASNVKSNGKPGAKRYRAEALPSPEGSNLLPSIQQIMDKQLEKIVERFSTLEMNLNEKVKQIESSVEELKVAIQFQGKEMEDLKENVASLEELVGEKEAVLQGEVDRLAAYVARENLIFMGIAEEDKEDTKQVLSKFYINHLKLSEELVEKIEYHRVHRVASQKKPRPIKARFLRFTDKLTIQNNARNLKGSSMHIADDLPKRVREVRQAQMFALKAARNAGKFAVFSRNDPSKLFVDHVWLPRKEQSKFVQNLKKVDGSSKKAGTRNVQAAMEVDEETMDAQRLVNSIRTRQSNSATKQSVAGDISAAAEPIGRQPKTVGKLVHLNIASSH